MLDKYDGFTIEALVPGFIPPALLQRLSPTDCGCLRRVYKRMVDSSVDVLIVGAGPVGLFLARELVQRGHSVRLVEQHAGQSEHSKALAIMPRTMEAFDAADIVESFEQVAHRVTAAVLISQKRELGRIAFTPPESRFPYVAMIAQDVTERLLVAALAQSGGRVEYETEFVACEQRGDELVATLRASGGEQRCNARFVVGCDGAHSTVRRIVDLPFEGSEYRDNFVLIDMNTLGDVPSNEMQLCPNESGPIAIFPITERRRRLVGTVDEDFKGNPDLNLANDLLAARGPGGMTAESIIWASTFRIHRRQTSQMRVGQMFLAGDAAHIHSPFGAQGMNTGLQDAWNLAWKLDFVLRGWGNDELLDTYTEERHPIAQHVIRTTDILTRAMSVANKPAQIVRDAVIPVLTHLEPFRAFFVSTLSELGVHISGSSIVAGPGRRVGDESVGGPAGTTRLYRAIAGRYLLVYPAGQPPLRSALTDLASRYGGAVAAQESTGERGGNVRLVRPDTYIAWEGSSSGGLDHLTAEIARVLDTHLRSKSASIH